MFSCAVRAVAIVVAVGLLSCSKKGAEPEGEQEVPMAFAPAVDWHHLANTKAGTNGLINSATDLQQYSISILGNATKAKQQGEGNDTYLVFNNHRLDYVAGTGWSYSPTKYWIQGAKYFFTAFAPFVPTTNSPADEKKVLSNGTFAISGTDENPVLSITGYNTGRVEGSIEGNFDARNEDLLHANVTRDNTTAEDYSPVALNFEHLLACVNFKIRNATSSDILNVTVIKIQGIEYMCDIEVTHGIGTAFTYMDIDNGKNSSDYFTSDDRIGTAEAPFLPKGMSESESKQLFDCGELTVLPQGVYGKGCKLTFTVDYGNSNTTNYTLDLSNIETIQEWDPGKKYNYNLTITSQDIIFQVVEVPWKEHEVEL